MNLRKVFSVVAGVALLASLVPVNVLGQASYGAELEGSYAYAKSIGATTTPTIDAARMFDSLTRAELAKVMSNFAENVVGLEADESADCSFNDLGSLAGSDLADYAVRACELGLMGVGTNGVFNPNGLVDRATFGTVLSRVIWGDKYNGGATRYANHLNALQAAGVMNNISNPMAPEVRGYAFLMMQRADEDGVIEVAQSGSDDCDDPVVQLSCLLGLDDCPAACADDGEDTDDGDDADDSDPVFVGEGELNVSLSRDTPDSMTIPGAVAGIVVAAFDFEAADEDIRIDYVTFERKGFSSDATIENYALTHPTIGRLSDTDDENSDDEVRLAIDGGLVVRAGQTETIQVLVDLASALPVSEGGDGIDGDSFELEIIEVGSTAENVDITSQRSELMTVGTQDGPALKVSDGSNVSDVKVGQVGAEIANFDFQNDDDEQDITIYSVTFENAAGGAVDTEVDLQNFVLSIDNEVVAETARAKGDYVTFMLDDGFVIEDGESFEVSVEADIIGGVNEKIDLRIEEELDITAEGSQFGMGISVVGDGDDLENISGDPVEVEAGEVTLSAIDPTFDERREDTDDVILGELVINVAEGEGLELQYIEFLMEIDSYTGSSTGIFDNVELLNVTRGGRVDLDQDGTGSNDKDVTFASDDDENIMLRQGRNTFRIIADINDDLENSYDEATFELKITDIDEDTDSHLIIEETSDDDQVDDLTPSTLTWDSWEGTDSSVDVKVSSLSSVDRVIGTENVIAMRFSLESNGGTDLEVEDFDFGGTGITNANISELRLYAGTTIDEGNLLASEGGSQINEQSNDHDGEFTFDDFTVDLPADETVDFLVTVSIEDDENISGHIELELLDARIKDTSDNTNLDLKDSLETDEGVSPRTITITEGGTFSVNIDNQDNNADAARYVLGGTASPYLAAFDIIVDDEAFELEEFQIYADGADADSFSDVVSEVHIVDAAGTVLATEPTVDGDNYVDFDNLDEEDFTFEDGTTTLYARILAKPIGNDNSSDFGAESITLMMSGFVAKGESSNTTQTGNTSESNKFGVVPVRISNINFVDEVDGGGERVSEFLTDGKNIVGILAITPDNNDGNSRTGNSTQPKLAIDQLDFILDASAGLDVTDIEIENASEWDATTGTISGDEITFAGLSGDNDYHITDTEYFIVTATLSGVSNNSSVQLSMEQLNEGAITFTTDQPGFGVTFEGARLDQNTKTARRIVPNN